MALKATDLRPIMTRLPEGLRKRLERSARDNRRSMNAEIIHRLVESYAAADTMAVFREGGREAAAASARALMQVVNMTLPPAQRLTDQELDQVVRKNMGEEDDKAMLGGKQ